MVIIINGIFEVNNIDMSYKVGQKVRLLNNRKIVTITKINSDGIPSEGVSDGEIIGLIGKVFLIIGLVEKIVALFKSLFGNRND